MLCGTILSSLNATNWTPREKGEEERKIFRQPWPFPVIGGSLENFRGAFGDQDPYWTRSRLGVPCLDDTAVSGRSRHET